MCKHGSYYNLHKMSLERGGKGTVLKGHLDHMNDNRTGLLIIIITHTHTTTQRSRDGDIYVPPPPRQLPTYKLISLTNELDIFIQHLSNYSVCLGAEATSHKVYIYMSGH